MGTILRPYLSGGIYSFATVLKVDIYASHHRGFRHGEACIDFIALRQQVFALDKDVGKTAQTVVGTQVPEYEAFLLLLARGDWYEAPSRIVYR